MICKPSSATFAVLLALLALPALAGSRDDPLADAAAAIERGDGVSAEVAAQRALAVGRPHSAVDAYLGEAALLQGDRDEARQWLASGAFDAASAQRGFMANCMTPPSVSLSGIEKPVRKSRSRLPPVMESTVSIMMRTPAPLARSIIALLRPRSLCT